MYMQTCYYSGKQCTHTHMDPDMSVWSTSCFLTRCFPFRLHKLFWNQKLAWHFDDKRVVIIARTLYMANFIAMVWKNWLRCPPHHPVRLKNQPLIFPAQKCIVLGVAFCLHLIFGELSTLVWFAWKPFYFSQCDWCGTMPRFSREPAQDGEQTEITKLGVERFSHLRWKANAQLYLLILLCRAMGMWLWNVANDGDVWQRFHSPLFSRHGCGPLHHKNSVCNTGASACARCSNFAK